MGGPGRGAVQDTPSTHHTPASLLRMYQSETTQPGENWEEAEATKIQTIKSHGVVVLVARVHRGLLISELLLLRLTTWRGGRSGR